MIFPVESAINFFYSWALDFKVASKKNSFNLNLRLMRSVYVTSSSRACHNYLDIEVSAVDTYARFGRGRVSYV